MACCALPPPPFCASARSRRVARGVAASCADPAPTVLVTRESGKNGPLVEALRSAGVESCFELPLIQHGAGADRPRLPAALQQAWDWVVLTSPEAAAVFLEGWLEAGQPPGLRLATVGGGTSKALQDRLPVAFTPSLANAETLAAELPAPAAGEARVLYPASALARAELQRGLAARGCFLVTRLDTYDTVPCAALPAGAEAAAAAAAVVTFASPSAVKAWTALRPAGASGAAVACIGLTSARAAAAAGLRGIYYPDQPGVEGWASAVLEALRGEPARDADLGVGSLSM